MLRAQEHYIILLVALVVIEKSVVDVVVATDMRGGILGWK